VASLNRRSVELARQARERVGGAREIAIAGSLSSWIAGGEAKNTPAPEAARASYREQAELLAEAGADLLILEMMRDVEQSRIMVEVAMATGLPLWVGFTCTLRADGTVLLRHRERQLAFVDALASVMAAGGSLVAVMHSDLDAIDPALDIVVQRWRGPIAVYPHSGDWTPPNWQFVNVITPEELARLARQWVERGVQVVGGCCGFGPDHIRALSKQVRGHRVPLRLAP
jgi:S-methylmethionine-dependent homocysteine/selenocysteine methylase